MSAESTGSAVGCLSLPGSLPLLGVGELAELLLLRLAALRFKTSTKAMRYPRGLTGAAESVSQPVSQPASQPRIESRTFRADHAEMNIPRDAEGSIKHIT